MLASARSRRKQKKAPRRITVSPQNDNREKAAAAALAAMRGRIDRITPSWRWAEDLYSDVVRGKVPQVKKIEKELDRRKAFPPGGAADTLMRTCPSCSGKWYPPQYIVSDKRVVDGDICADCLEIGRAPTDEEKAHGDYVPTMEGRADLPLSGGTTTSIVAVAAHAMREMNVVVSEPKLLTEDDNELRRMVEEQAARIIKGMPVELHKFNFSGDDSAPR